MLMKMASLSFRKESSQLQFRKRIPADLLSSAPGKFLLFEFPSEKGDSINVPIIVGANEIRFSLRTKTPYLAMTRSLIAEKQTETFFSTLRLGNTELSQKQIVALSGDVYRLFVENFEHNPGSPQQWAAFKAFNRAVLEGRVMAAPALAMDLPDETQLAEEAFGNDLSTGINDMAQSSNREALEQRFGRIATWVLSKHQIVVASATRILLLQEVAKAASDAGWQLKRNANGDYTPDVKAARFPAVVLRGSATLDELFEKWVTERNPVRSTSSYWKQTIEHLKTHLGHQDVSRISEAEIVGWKDKLFAQGLTAKTINGSYLACFNTLMEYAIGNKMLKENPASRVKALVQKQTGRSRLPYRNIEVGQLLGLIRDEGSVDQKWLVWLCAATGARIGEIAQLWGKQIQSVDGIMCLHITPADDGGSLKNEGSERVVPIHPDIVAEGFLDFVASKGDGPLFYRFRANSNTVRHPSKSVANHLATWIRGRGFVDKRKAPNHALRHWWKSAALEYQIEDSVADWIQGHVPQHAAATYRHVSIAVLYREIQKMPLACLLPYSIEQE